MNSHPIKAIEIANFGALGNVSLQLNKPLQLIIGPQASGKSTLGKTIYFCRKIRDYLTDYAREVLNRREDSEYYTNFIKYLRNPFMGCFGTTKHMEPFTIRYYYDSVSNKYVTITIRKGFAHFQFSDSLKNEIKSLINDVIKISRELPNTLADSYFEQTRLLDLFKLQTYKIFADDDALLYIPAGRNLLATIPDLIQPDSGSGSILRNTDITQTDAITQEFIHYIQRMRIRFGSKLEEMTQVYLKTVKGQIQNRDVELACSLVKEILKADYVCDNEGEKLYYDKNNWVKLMFGSSGQQEVLWALNCIFLAILQHEKTFLVFEEPESHVFPDSQEMIAQLVALLINSSDSEVFLTTHSPYMLTAFNLLIFSGSVEGNNTFNQVVEKRYRLKPRSVAAYLIPNSKGSFRNLIDTKRGLIDALEIDHLSNTINERMERLLIKQIDKEKLKKGDVK